MIRTLSLAAIAAFIVTGLAWAAQSITLQPGESVTITAAGSGPTPPPQVTCPDGSVHPPGYVCPVAPPSGQIVCPGFDKTIVLSINWAAPQRMIANGFNANDAVVATFTTGSGQSQSNNLPRIAGAEYGAGAANRVAALSSKPCDFGPQEAYYSYQISSAPTIPFTLNNPYIYPGLYANLANNTTYFFNVKNDPGSGCIVNCNFFTDLSKNGAN